MAAMAQSAADWCNTHTQVDHMHSLTLKVTLTQLQSLCAKCKRLVDSSSKWKLYIYSLSFPFKHSCDLVNELKVTDTNLNT